MEEELKTAELMEKEVVEGGSSGGTGEQKPRGGRRWRWPMLMVMLLVAIGGIVAGAGLIDVDKIETFNLEDDRYTVSEAERVGMKNPAAVYCSEMGYEYKIVETNEGQQGICVLPTGDECDEWDFYAGECGNEYTYCAKNGLLIAPEAKGDAFAANCTTCVLADGSHRTVSDLLNLDIKSTVGTMTFSGNDSIGSMGSDEMDIIEVETSLPNHFDWRDKDGANWMTPVKSQGDCGSCWAFSAVGIVEPSYNIFLNDPDFDIDLSEQYLVSECFDPFPWYMYDCEQGGKSGPALSFIRDKGITDEACFPYVASSGPCDDRCPDWSSRLKRIDGTGRVPSSNIETIKEFLIEQGPLSVSMGYGGTYGGHFDGDVYRCTRDYGSNHAVVLAGYDETEDYWIVKNSWGTGFGDNGYFNVGFGECAIEKEVFYASTYADNWYVDDNLADFPDADFTRIQDAVDAASPGDTIIVYPGNYIENVDVDKDHLAIQSESGATSAIVQAADSAIAVFSVSADYISISGFTIKGVGTVTGKGIDIHYADYCSVSNNHILDNGDGIFTYHSNNIDVRNNNIELNSDRGIESWYLTDSTITDNIVNSNSFIGIHLINSANNGIMRNNVLSNYYSGIYLPHSFDNLIYLNNFANNTENANNYEATNTWSSTEHAIYNYNNNAYSNYLGNYWGDYIGTDVDGNGIGDTPYSINGDNDNYPLIEPFEHYGVVPIPPPPITVPFKLVSSLSMNVKTAYEVFTVVDYYGTPVSGAFVSNWQAVEGAGTGEVEIIAGGEDGDNSITVRMVVQGNAMVTCEVDNGKGYKAFLNAEKKWGEIAESDLDANQISNIQVNDQVLVTETVYAQFLPDMMKAPAGGAKITWWLLENDAADEAQSALEDLLEQFGPGNYGYVSGPMGYGEGCGPYSWWGYGGDGTFFPEDLLNGLYASYGAKYTDFTKAEGHTIAVPMTKYHTYTDSEGEALGVGTTNIGVQFNDTGQGEAEPVIVVVLADYPLDKTGENAICVEYMTFTPHPAVVPSLIKTPQVRWAGERIVLEQDFNEFVPLLDKEYIAVFHVEDSTIGELSVAGNNPSIEKPWGDVWVLVGPDDYIPETILLSDVQGHSVVNAQIYALDPLSDTYDPPTWNLIGDPLINYGFIVFYLVFEDVLLTDQYMGALVDITPENTLVNIPVYEDVPVAVQVRGWFTSDRLGPAIDPDTDDIRAQKLVDINNDGISDTVLPEGRWVLPNDWWAIAGYNFALRPNYDLMDQAHEDDIVSLYNPVATSLGEEGPYDSHVRTTDPPGEAEAPTIGPFNTLQQWSYDLLWDASAIVDSSTGYLYRNTVVPDGVMSWYDCPMPQALVTFDIIGYSLPTGAISLTGLDKGNLEGYGYSNDAYNSPFYHVEIPSHWAIAAGGYDWSSWYIDGPYDYWTDLLKNSIDDDEPAIINPLDIEVYCDNHGIAGLTVDAPYQVGMISIVATTDYPDALLKGTYPPHMSSEITVVWGGPCLDADFEGVPRACEDAQGCFVTFTNWTMGGVLPYSDAVWDFGDGSLPVHGAIDSGDIITHCYTAAGLYTVTMTIWDADNTEAYQVEIDYITVSDGGLVTNYTVDFSDSGYFPIHLPDAYNGQVVLVDLLDVPSEVQGIYWYDCSTFEWKFWAPGAPGCTLPTLGGGHSYDYMVTVTGPCEWEIPIVGVIPTPMPLPSVPHSWGLCSSGFFPQHLPDSYDGQVVLADLLDIPDEVQGVYWYDCNAMEWKFWAPGAPGCTLTTLGGGHAYDYMVTVTGDCDWSLLLQ